MKSSLILGLLAMLLAIAFTGCLGFGGNNFNTNTPVNVEIGIGSDRNSHDVYLVLRDLDREMTTSEGVAVITAFRGKFQDNNPDSVNEFVFSETYNVRRDQFQRVDMLHKRDVKQSSLMWKTKMPNEFDPKAFDVYKLTVVFQPVNINHRLVNQTYIVWG